MTMTKHIKLLRNAFAFSRAGMTTISSFTAAPAIADDQLKTVPEKRGGRIAPWLGFYHQAAHFVAE